MNNKNSNLKLKYLTNIKPFDITTTLVCKCNKILKSQSNYVKMFNAKIFFLITFYQIKSVAVLLRFPARLVLLIKLLIPILSFSRCIELSTTIIILISHVAETLWSSTINTFNIFLLKYCIRLRCNTHRLSLQLLRTKILNINIKNWKNQT